MKNTNYFVYILTCSDGTYYVGITTDLNRRIAEHNSTKSITKYTRARQPLKLSYFEEFTSRSTATIRELELKKLSRIEKSKLLNYLH